MKPCSAMGGRQQGLPVGQGPCRPVSPPSDGGEGSRAHFSGMRSPRPVQQPVPGHHLPRWQRQRPGPQRCLLTRSTGPGPHWLLWTRTTAAAGGDTGSEARQGPGQPMCSCCCCSSPPHPGTVSVRLRCWPAAKQPRGQIGRDDWKGTPSRWVVVFAMDERYSKKTDRLLVPRRAF